MPEPQYVDFKPRWWQSEDKAVHLADTPNTGFEPLHVPRLPTRIIPVRHESCLTALTLSEAISCTQRILNYVAYELVHGPQSNIDLRSADEHVLRLARLNVEPFEEGSFVIPASMSEDDVAIGSDRYSSAGVLDRFIDVMHQVADPKFHTSLGVVQAIEDLGKITRREAERIEYNPSNSARREEIIVDTPFIESVARSRRERSNPTVIPDELVGTVTAVDLVRASFNIRLDNSRVTVRGKFESFAEDRILRSLNTRIRATGTVEYLNNQPRVIRAFFIELLE